LPNEPLYLKGDSVRLGQIFSNLLNNAAKYTELGGKITVTAEELNNKIIIKVVDNGIGIASEKLTRIFDLFTQVDNSIERAQGGLGIGLTLVKNLIERQGGSVEATSEGIGRGSTFTVTMPKEAPELVINAVSELQTSTPIPMSLSLKVLVVDDNVASAKTIGWAIELFGHEPKVITNSAIALDEAQLFLPDIVLLDIGMPGMNGYELCRAMRCLPGLQKTIFIAQTGWGQQEHRQRSREAGFHHHLVKPIDLNVLEKLLANLIDYSTPSN